MPNEFGLTAKAFDGLNDIVLAVRAGENDHTHSRRHATTVPSAVLSPFLSLPPTAVADRRDLALGKDRNGGVLDDGVGQQPSTELVDYPARLPLVGSVHVQAERLTGADLADPGEAERRQGALDRRSLGIGNARSQLHLDEHFEICHQISPSVNRRSRAIQQS